MTETVTTPAGKRAYPKERTRDELAQARDELEIRVEERTAELRDANERLRRELMERREANLRLRSSEQAFRDVVENSPDVIVRYDREGRRIYVNPEFERVNRLSAREVLGKTPVELSTELAPMADVFTEKLMAAMESGVIGKIDLSWTNNGKPMCWFVRVVPEFDADGAVVSALTIWSDITERKQAENEIRHLKNYLANIIDSMPAMLVGMDSNEIITQWNLQAAKFTGIPAAQAVGRPLGELIPDFSPWIEALRREIRYHTPASMEKLLIERGGERHFYDLMLYPLITNGFEGAVLRIEDVTERTRIRELMIQTEKMMSIGGLAAGMAHEINNPLGIITQAARNIERRVSPELPANQEAAAAVGVSLDGIAAYFEHRRIPEFIASILEAASRATRIIANMLRFSRRSETTLQPASLATVMEQAVELAANDYDLKKRYDFRGIEIIRDIAPNMPDVPVAATEIEQVLLNLLKNAAQAMAANPPERPPRIALRLKQEERYALLEVEDNGPGMAEDVRRRVFEPFFTTKEPGIGTGLGLSVSYMIVTQNHKGLMEAASAPGNGTRFTVRLPLQTEINHE